MAKTWTARKVMNLRRKSNIRKVKFQMQLMVCCNTRMEMLSMRPSWVTFSSLYAKLRVKIFKLSTSSLGIISKTFKPGILILTLSLALKNWWKQATSEKKKKVRIWLTGQRWLSLVSTHASKVLIRPPIAKPSIYLTCAPPTKQCSPIVFLKSSERFVSWPQ